MGAGQPTRQDGRFVGLEVALDVSIDLRHYELRRLWDLGYVGGSAGRVSALIRIAKRALAGLQRAGGTKIGLWLLPISEAMR